MAERQEQHRQQLERVAIYGDARRADRGPYAGTFVVSLAIIAGFILVVLGHDWAGGVFVGLGLTALAGVFVYGTQSRRSERKERRAELAERQESNASGKRRKP